MAKTKILVVEDEDNLAQYIKLTLQSLGYEVTAVVSSGEEAVQKAFETNPDLLLTDIMLKGEIDGVEAARRIHEHSDIPVIYLTSYANDQMLRRAKLTEPFGYLLKPFEKRGLHTSIEMALYKHKMEKKLKENERWLATTLKSIGDAVIVANAKTRIEFMNPVAEILTGWKLQEALGKYLGEILNILDEETHTVRQSSVKEAIQSGSVVDLANHTILISKDGKEIPIAASTACIKNDDGNISGVVLVLRDITKQDQMEKALQKSHDELELRVHERTEELAKANEALQAEIIERKKMEEELLKVRNLESLGVLAGGIAHDFNNLLTAILGNISLFKLHANPEDNIHKKLIEAEKACIRASDLTQQLLTFSKGGAPVKKVSSSLGELIKDTANFVLSSSNLRYELTMEDHIWTVEIDQGQISQVIHNLVINAKQAIPEGGRIKLNVENVVVRMEEAIPLKEGRYVKVTVEDNGIGIPEEHLSSIFDPYFTTKKEGSGLGLTMVYSILKNHGGYIGVKSEIGMGTKFYFYLPAADKPIVDESKMAETLIEGRGKVLFMDDEEFIRETTGEILRSIGYQVELVKDGVEAIDAYKKAKEAGKPFDVIIMDLVIPEGMGGIEAIKILLELDPNTKAIVSSGYSNTPVMADYQRYGFKGVVAKPYKIEELSNTIHKLVNER